MTPLHPESKLDYFLLAAIALAIVVGLGYVAFWGLLGYGLSGFERFPEPSLDVNCNEFQYADRTPRWSADGQLIVVNPGERLLGVNLNGGEPFVIRGNTGERQYSPSLSRDGRVAYQIGFENRVSDTHERHTAIADLSGSEVEFVAQERHCSSIYPVWSPDGKRLAFITEPISSREGRWLSIVDAVGPTARHSIPPGFQKFSKRVCEKGLNLHGFLLGSGSAILLLWGYEQKTLSQRFDRRPVGRISPLAAAKQTQGPSSDRGLAGSSKWRSVCAARRHTLAHDAP